MTLEDFFFFASIVTINPLIADEAFCYSLEQQMVVVTLLLVDIVWGSLRDHLLKKTLINAAVTKRSDL